MARKLTAALNVMVTPKLKRALQKVHLRELPQAEFSAWLRGKLAAMVKGTK